MITINLKGREIPLLYTTWEMKQIQEEIAPLGTALKLVLGKNPEDDEDTSPYGGVKHLTYAATLIKILGNSGLEDAGETPDLTEKMILRALKPSQLMDTISACLNAMGEGMASEIPEKKKEGPVDVVLEEIEKKKERDG